MVAEQLTRGQLLSRWQSNLENLRSQGEDVRHIQRFLWRLESLPGQTVGDLCDAWSQRQSERRPCWVLFWLGVWLLAALAGQAGIGVGLLPLALFHAHKLWDWDQRFSRELLARADAAL